MAGVVIAEQLNKLITTHDLARVNLMKMLRNTLQNAWLCVEFPRGKASYLLAVATL